MLSSLKGGLLVRLPQSPLRLTTLSSQSLLEQALALPLLPLEQALALPLSPLEQALACEIRGPQKQGSKV